MWAAFPLLRPRRSCWGSCQLSREPNGGEAEPPLRERDRLPAGPSCGPRSLGGSRRALAPLTGAAALLARGRGGRKAAAGCPGRGHPVVLCASEFMGQGPQHRLSDPADGTEMLALENGADGCVTRHVSGRESEMTMTTERTAAWPRARSVTGRKAAALRPISHAAVRESAGRPHARATRLPRAELPSHPGGAVRTPRSRSVGTVLCRGAELGPEQLHLFQHE